MTSFVSTRSMYIERGSGDVLTHWHKMMTHTKGM